MQEWEENKMQMYVHPAHETWAISFPSNPCRAPKTQKKNHHHTPSQKTQTHTHRSLSFLTWANLHTEEANLTQNCHQNLKNPSHPSQRHPGSAPFCSTTHPRTQNPTTHRWWRRRRWRRSGWFLKVQNRGLTQFGATPSALHRRNASAIAFGFFDRLMTWSYLQRRCKQTKTLVYSKEKNTCKESISLRVSPSLVWLLLESSLATLEAITEEGLSVLWLREQWEPLPFYFLLTEAITLAFAPILPRWKLVIFSVSEGR
jgi:hypothetical protein